MLCLFRLSRETAKSFSPAGTFHARTIACFFCPRNDAVVLLVTSEVTWILGKGLRPHQVMRYSVEGVLCT